MPTPQRLRELFYYDPNTGLLYRRTSSGGRKAGTVAGHRRPGNSHCVVRVEDRLQLVHRVVWTMVKGPIPAGMVIDHQDGNTYNNRLNNLRLTTHQGNGQNSRLSRNNTSGHLGVHFSKIHNYWEAQIWVNRKKHWLGCFKSKAAAISARGKAEKEFGFHPNHGQKRAPTASRG